MDGRLSEKAAQHLDHGPEVSLVEVVEAGALSRRFVGENLHQGWPLSEKRDRTFHAVAQDLQRIRAANVLVQQFKQPFCAWTDAVIMGVGIISASFEGWPTISSDGIELFFTSSRKSLNELLVARRAKVTDPWGKPVGLGVQGATPDISPDGRYLFFANTPDWGAEGEGGLDIFVMKRKNRTEPFGKPARLGAPINTDTDDYSPNVSEDGKSLTFYSKGKIWRVPLTSQ